jgi:hypothetical protein
MTGVMTRTKVTSDVSDGRLLCFKMFRRTSGSYFRGLRGATDDSVQIISI